METNMSHDPGLQFYNRNLLSRAVVDGKTSFSNGLESKCAFTDEYSNLCVVDEYLEISPEPSSILKNLR